MEKAMIYALLLSPLSGIQYALPICFSLPKYPSTKIFFTFRTSTMQTERRGAPVKAFSIDSKHKSYPTIDNSPANKTKIQWPIFTP